MNNIIRNMMTVMLLLVGSTPALHAQFNPTNPPEPDYEIVEPVKHYKVSISVMPASVAYVTSGGSYTSGYRKYIYTSLTNSKYKFSHWTLNGEFFSANSSFNYTVETADANFVAHYEFNPSSPVEPERVPDIIVSPLYLVTNNGEACSFNQASGNEHEAESWVTLEAFVAKGYEFKGWYQGSTLISSNVRFNYQMPDEAVTLTAKVEKIVFNPTNPSEPDSSQDNVQTTLTGDVNKDGVLNVFDIVSIVNYSLGEADENLPLYDLNGDKAVNVFDIVKIVNLSLE
ncbi:MAG: dockerin type I repeat-containing protein [Bacteroidaceae bacterium]|nr:dockerin type I repeat-containing protein [Bacteroidaceae bacterium]